MGRPALQRGAPLGHQLASVIDAGNSAATAARMVNREFDDIRPHSQLSQPRHERTAQIVNAPRWNIPIASSTCRLTRDQPPGAISRRSRRRIAPLDAPNASNQLRARGASGTRCARPFFVLAPGISHSLRSVLSSDHRMSLTSRRRQPVSARSLSTAAACSLAASVELHNRASSGRSGPDPWPSAFPAWKRTRTDSPSPDDRATAGQIAPTAPSTDDARALRSGLRCAPRYPECQSGAPRPARCEYRGRRSRSPDASPTVLQGRARSGRAWQCQSRAALKSPATAGFSAARTPRCSPSRPVQTCSRPHVSGPRDACVFLGYAARRGRVLGDLVTQFATQPAVRSETSVGCPRIVGAVSGSRASGDFTYTLPKTSLAGRPSGRRKRSAQDLAPDGWRRGKARGIRRPGPPGEPYRPSASRRQRR